MSSLSTKDFRLEPEAEIFPKRGERTSRPLSADRADETSAPLSTAAKETQ